MPDVPVAVRSSATAEDGAEASFAGQQDTYLNVCGGQAVAEHVRKCWSSLYTPRAIFYRKQAGLPHGDVRIAVAVQRMVASESSGVVFTIDPVTGDRSRIVIESTWGLGEALVGGHVRPDRFVVDKRTLSIQSSDIVHKGVQLLPDSGPERTREHAVDPERADAPSLTPEEVMRLAETAVRIESHYGAPQDIEFAVEWIGSARRIRIVQARPETVHSRGPKASRGGPPRGTAGAQARVAVKGLGASPGMASGAAKVVRTPAEAARELGPGDILVTKMTNPDWVPYMKVAGAIVTEDGGVTCHAAIVSREMGVPCIVGARDATKSLRHGADYTADGRTGVVHEGRVEPERAAQATSAPSTPSATGAAPSAPPVTSTRVYVNLSIPEIADKVARETQADGVGLLRAEHMLLGVGRHPRHFIEEGREQEFVDAFAEGIRRVAAAFAPRPVVYRFLDLKPDEFLHLEGGERFERDAGHVGPNPLLGYRGCFRYTKEPDIFRLECRALRKVRDEHGLRNVHAMVPFVRTLREFQHAKRLMEAEGLRRGRDFRLWIMVEVPSTVLTIERFLDEGLDGVSFGTNDLTMLILGIDRDDAMMQEVYDERNPAVLRAMQMVVRACSARGVTTSVCGQAPSNHPEVVEFLVREGATSLSVNPDKVVETKTLVAGIERKVLLEGMRDLQAAPRPSLPPLAPPRNAWWT
jgi:pyruvate, water dikinase